MKEFPGFCDEFRKILILCLMSITLCGCDGSQDDNRRESLIKSFQVKVDNEYISSTIDESAGEIIIKGIRDGSLIVGVDYELAENATVYPKPETWLHEWQHEERFIITQNGRQQFYVVILADNEKEEEDLGDAVISPEKYYGRQIKDFFYDLKLNAGAINTLAKANEFFIEDDMNGVRISIYGDATRPAHPEPGKIEESYYTKMIASINRAKIARGDRGLTIFASKKLDGKNSFPDWVKDKNGVIPEKYGQMLVDYILYMRDQDIVVDVLGIDNEINFNEGNITPQKHMQIVDYLKEQSTKQNFKMPLIVGPERYEPMGDVENGWWKKFLDSGWGDRIDIYGTHYYPEHRYFEKLRFELSLIGERPFWATEPHWGSETAQPDILNHAETAICALWDQTDLGMDGFMWWDYKRDGNLRGCLMRAVSASLRGARPVEMTDHDGVDIFQKGKLQTRAFREGNQLNVYAINMCPENDLSEAVNYENYEFGLDEGTIDGEVTYTQWRDNTPVEGEDAVANKVSDKTFSVNLPRRSITHIQFQLK
ncbi:DUF4971 domain-containing protein [Bacteroides sp.]|uniref:DUF4971 domain-containing protein n=1 Tax=Bacteroides sp. TaxID=29523 RepID=UPI0025C66AF3|nr:DUF4971 domain-containing protein [Bacteroides sp.]